MRLLQTIRGARNFRKGAGGRGERRRDRVREIGLDLSMDEGWTRFSGGAEVNAIPLNAAGRVKSADGTTTVELASAQATVQGIKAALARPSTVRIVNGETALDKFALNVGGGSSRLSGKAGKTLTSTRQWPKCLPRSSTISRPA